MSRILAFLLTVLAPIASIGAPAAASDELSNENPKRGGTLRLAYASDYVSLDTAHGFFIDSSALQRLVFRGLFDYDDHDQLVLEQARSWEISSDKATYTFKLQPGIRFANGREVEAADYVFSLERVLEPRTASEGQRYYRDIRGAGEFIEGKSAHVAGLRAPDRQTLVIELTDPSYVFAFKLALSYAFVVPREVVQRQGKDFANHAIGSGPYVLAERQRGRRLRFTRNPHYTRPDGYADAIDVMIGGDPSLFTMMTERGELDMAFPGPADYVRLARDAHRQGVLLTYPMAVLDYLFMNTQMKPFDKVLVRRGVNFALDRQRLYKLILPCAPAYGITPGSTGANDSDLHPYRYDPQKARDLLRQAGYSHGFDTDLWYIPDYYQRLAQGIEADLRAVGIRASLHPISPASFADKSGSRGQMALGLANWVWDFPDASSFFDPTLNGSKISDTECLNTAFYDNPEVNRLIAQLDHVFQPNDRQRILHRMEKIVMDDAPWAPIDFEQNAVLYPRRLHGFRPHPLWGYRLETLWLDN